MLSGATHYGQIDLRSAYHQLPLHPESHSLAAFITHERLFRFTRVAFGLASAPSAFQKMMQTILKDLPGVQNCLDDIVVYRDSKEMHNKPSIPGSCHTQRGPAPKPRPPDCHFGSSRAKRHMQQWWNHCDSCFAQTQFQLDCCSR